jgi:hypothetical protein
MLNEVTIIATASDEANRVLMQIGDGAAGSERRAWIRS